ncbi:MAG: DUF4388 domain-containing protein [Vicinamibacteria bacterium]
MSELGTLADVRLADVLRLLASGRKSGALQVSDGASKASLRFTKGALVQAVCGRYTGDEAVVDLFGWEAGSLVFVADERPATTNVTRGLDVLIEEGLREGSARHRLHQHVPNDRAVFHWGLGPEPGGPIVGLAAAQWTVLRAADGVRDVREIAELLELEKAEVAQIVADLVDARLLERVELWKPLRAQASSGPARDVAAIDERIEQEWLRMPRFAGGVSRVEVKAASGKEAALAVAFRAGLFRDVQLPKPALAALGLREGEDVHVRPIG